MKTISFCINTARNELNHIKLLLRSMEENLSNLDHEIVVFIDSDNQGTFEWLLTQKAVFPNLKILRNELPICYGYARNINEMFEFASNEIVSYLQSDMVVCKDYDIEVLKNLEKDMVMCSTRIEPPLHGNSGEKITYDFGLDPVTFDLKSFTSYADTQKKDNITEYFFAPFTMYKAVWNSIGGHDTLFRRSREDSDVLMRLVLNNTKIKQTWSALVYHFTCTSSRGSQWHDINNKKAQERVAMQQAADRIELSRFNKKWGKFVHATAKQPYYQVAANIQGTSIPLNDFRVVESVFDKVYVGDTDLIQLTQEAYDREHIAANKLLNINSQQWKDYGYMYNQLNAEDRIFPTQDSYDDDVVISFDFNSITPELFHTFISNIQDIIHSTEEVGDYEYGPFKITVNNKEDRSSERIKVSNPTVKTEHKYTIH